MFSRVALSRFLMVILALGGVGCGVVVAAEALSPPVGPVGPVCHVPVAASAQTPGRPPLQSASPRAGEVLTVAPAEIDLMFSEPMNSKFTGVEVTGPGEIAVKTRDPMQMAHDRLFMATLDGTLAPGVYTIAWHALSADGHARNGEYTFVLYP